MSSFDEYARRLLIRGYVADYCADDMHGVSLPD
jgi:hypothetical protein